MYLIARCIILYWGIHIRIFKKNIRILLTHVKVILGGIGTHSYQLGTWFEQSDDYRNVPYHSENILKIQIDMIFPRLGKEWSHTARQTPLKLWRLKKRYIS